MYRETAIIGGLSAHMRVVLAPRSVSATAYRRWPLSSSASCKCERAGRSFGRENQGVRVERATSHHREDLEAVV